MAVAVAAGALVGIVPALRLARANLNLVLREGGRGVAGGGHKFRDALVTVQVGSALILLIMAGLFTRSLTQSEHAELGFNPANVLTMMMDPGEIGYNDPHARDFYKDAAGAGAGDAGGAVGDDCADRCRWGWWEMAGTRYGGRVSAAGGAERAVVSYNLIGTDYFQTLEIPMARGAGLQRRGRRETSVCCDRERGDGEEILAARGRDWAEVHDGTAIRRIRSRL